MNTSTLSMLLTLDRPCIEEKKKEQLWRSERDGEQNTF